VAGAVGSGKLNGQKTSSLDRLKARQILKYCLRIFAVAFSANVTCVCECVRVLIVSVSLRLDTKKGNDNKKMNKNIN